MKLFSIYLYGVCLCMGLFNAFAVLFGTPQLAEFAFVVTAGGNPINAALGILGIFINALLAIAYFVMGLVYLRRESVGTLDVNEAMVGWLSLLVLFGVNFFGANLMASMLTRLSSGLLVP